MNKQGIISKAERSHAYRRLSERTSSGLVREMSRRIEQESACSMAINESHLLQLRKKETVDEKEAYCGFWKRMVQRIP